MGFFSSVMMVLSHFKQGEVELVFHEPLHVKEFSSRKELAFKSEQSIRNGLFMS
jgi:1-acyl-sn-glycerol-3-phosphate acyltransferase